MQEKYIVDEQLLQDVSILLYFYGESGEGEFRGKGDAQRMALIHRHVHDYLRTVMIKQETKTRFESRMMGVLMARRPVDIGFTY